MDELKLNLRTNIFKNAIAGIVEKILKKKLKIDVDLSISDLSIESKDGKFYIHADVNAETTNQDLIKVIKSIDIL